MSNFKLFIISGFLLLGNSCLGQAELLSLIDKRAMAIEQLIADKKDIATMSDEIPCYINGSVWRRISWIDTIRSQVLKGMYKSDCKEEISAVFYFSENKICKVEINETLNPYWGLFYFENDSIVFQRQSGDPLKYDYNWMKGNIEHFNTRPRVRLELKRYDSVFKKSQELAYQLADSVVFEVDTFVGPVYGHHLRYKLSYDGSGNLLIASRIFEEKEYFTRFYFKGQRAIFWETYTKETDDYIGSGIRPEHSRIQEWQFLEKLVKVRR